MWQEIFDYLSTTAAVIFAGASIKIADDYLDKDIDSVNLATFLGNGSMVYALLFFAFAAIINARVSSGLFIASYIVGMFCDKDSKFPSRLKGWQEIFILLLLGGYLLTYRELFFYINFIWAVQLFDDFIDTKVDALAGRRNWVHRLGPIESIAFFLLSLCICHWLNTKLLYPLLTGTAITYGGTVFFTRRVKQ